MFATTHLRTSSLRGSSVCDFDGGASVRPSDSPTVRPRLGLRRWREWGGGVGDERGVWSQNCRTGCGSQADRHLGPHSGRGTSCRACGPGGAAESGCVLMTRLARWLSPECGDMWGVLMRRSSVMTRVHVAL